MTTQSPTTAGLFAFLAAKAEGGQRIALVTITAVSGSSMRNPGAHLAVAEDGDWRGSLSGGCIEAAVVAEAIEAIGEGKPRQMRFGTGSPYIDIRLPCGGSIDVLVSPLDGVIAAAAARLLAARQPFVLTLPLDDGAATIAPGEPSWRTRREPDSFAVAELPALALAIIGHGAAVEALDTLARGIGAETRVFTPDRAIADRLAAGETPVTLLRLPDETIDLAADRWTAIAFLFHDHEWETALIAQALGTPAFYIGAMGSRAAHARRVALLGAAGVSAAATARLHAPIGLIPSSRDPHVLALSVLAEIVRDFDRATARADVTGKAGTPGASAGGRAAPGVAP